jgi:polar amino acid transport system substrate-binding protein
MNIGLLSRWVIVLRFGLVSLIALVLINACNSVAKPTTANQPSSDKLSDVLASGVLIIATDPAAAPHSEFLQDQPRAENTRCNTTQYTANQFAGFDVDVAVGIATRLGVEPCFVTPSWSQIITGNWGGLWDVTIQSMVITPGRMERLYFTQPYVAGEMFLYVHQANQIYQQLSDLNGKKIGVCAGCANEAYLRRTLQIPGEDIQFTISDPIIFGYDTDLSAIQDLAVGDGQRLDAVITDPDTAAVALQAGLAIKQLGGVLYRDFSAVAVDKMAGRDPVEFVKKLTEIIQQMHQDGTLVGLSNEYYGGDFTTAASKIDFNSLGQFP